jgi:hypothetical protein
MSLDAEEAKPSSAILLTTAKEQSPTEREEQRTKLCSPWK